MEMRNGPAKALELDLSESNSPEGRIDNSSKRYSEALGIVDYLKLPPCPTTTGSFVRICRLSRKAIRLFNDCIGAHTCHFRATFYIPFPLAPHFNLILIFNFLPIALFWVIGPANPGLPKTFVAKPIQDENEDELWAYETLGKLQGDVIPRCYGSIKWRDASSTGGGWYSGIAVEYLQEYLRYLQPTDMCENISAKFVSDLDAISAE
ncbi:hypothetical protein MBM_05074 [Drepanopeziza brunnea f. sp. 'multigermtubi' MB_m1]|uniref:Uncharacterized protein n=1 Tax=Marssonina brunnea f. sp. multigermtubi (strain MB_m1) TaxID=1072389 RepID=K1WGE5_MARBU|nr:uncharacterized protein MBM_05074 [Drepanopeziza brunnea f. sp. 'multigermtubi' MB_m1]EKD16605.1 hypothetical protein MBM_05074 [Drepanopeziza brunnea f. sp. 'multigermtubi' MB_m1]